jgi:hypothetical protein
MSADSGLEETFWQSAVHRLSRRIHLGWWLDQWLALLIPLSLLGAVTILGLRYWRDLPLPTALIGIGSGLALAAMAAVFLMRRRREPLATTRVRLEDALGLKTRLTAAAAGIGPWPARRTDLPLPVTFSPGRPLVMVAIGAALLTAALVIPISKYQPEAPRIIEPPSALKEIQDWIDHVKKNDAVNEESIEQVEEKMAELLQRPAQNWYEHASLEAADHLRDVTAQDLQQLAQNLADAERAANALAASAAGAGLPQAAKDSLEQLLQNASQSMQTAGMQPSSDLIDALKNMDPSQLSSMSSEQMKDLAKQLAQNQQALQEALKNTPSLDFSNLPEGRPGDGEGEGQGKGDKSGPGKGGIGRGPGTAPVTLASEDTQLGTDKIETLKNPLDLTRLATGDALSITNGAAKVDPKNYQGPQQGGATASPGDGGAAVWQNTLIPTQRETLKRFFK